MEVAVKVVPKRNHKKYAPYRKLVRNEKEAMLRMDGLGQFASLQAFFSDRDYWYIITVRHLFLSCASASVPHAETCRNTCLVGVFVVKSTDMANFLWSE
jgi:hypothetical protein